MVVQGHIAQQRCVRILLAVEPMRLQDVFNPVIEALHHAIGPGRSGLGQTMLYVQGLAQAVKLVIATGLVLPAGKQPIGELLAVVSQDAADPDRAGSGQGIEERLGAGCALVALDLRWPGRWPRTDTVSCFVRASAAGTYFTSMCTKPGS